MITWHTFKTSQNYDIQWIWSGGWEWLAVSGVIGRWSWFYLHIYAVKICLLLNTPAAVSTTLRCRRNSRRFESGVPENIFLNRTRDSEAGNIRKQLWLRIPKGINGELYYKNNRKLPIPGQIELILIFSSSAIEFLFVILYLLLNFYKHVTKMCRDLCTSLFEIWNFAICIILNL